MPPNKLRKFQPESLGRRPIRFAHFALRAQQEYRVGDGVESQLPFPLGAKNFLLQTPGLVAIGLLAQGAPKGHGQTIQAMLQHIIGGALLDVIHGCFVAQRRGHHDERELLAGLLERIERIDARPVAQVVVTQDGVVVAPLQPLVELIGPVHQIERQRVAGPLECGDFQLSVRAAVFYNQQAQEPPGRFQARTRLRHHFTLRCLA